MGTRKARAGFTSQQTDALAHRWDQMVKSPISVEFDSFGDFCEWAKETGYDYGVKLIRIDQNGPFSPDNCQWREIEKSPATIENQKILAKQWDDFITPIRERYAPYLEGRKTQELPKRSAFRYEHPDLEREGIVFECSIHS